MSFRLIDELRTKVIPVVQRCRVFDISCPVSTQLSVTAGCFKIRCLMHQAGLKPIGQRQFTYTAKSKAILPIVTKELARQSSSTKQRIRFRHDLCADRYRNRLVGQTHGLMNKVVMHIFWMDRDKVTRFDIQDRH